MYAIVRRYEGVTDPSEAGRLVEEEFATLLAKIPGFVAYYWVNAGEGIMVSTSVFENEAGIEASNRLAAKWLHEADAFRFLPRPPQITWGEVVAHRGQ